MSITSIILANGQTIKIGDLFMKTGDKVIKITIEPVHGIDIATITTDEFNNVLFLTEKGAKKHTFKFLTQEGYKQATLQTRLFKMGNAPYFGRHALMHYILMLDPVPNFKEVVNTLELSESYEILKDNIGKRIARGKIHNIFEKKVSTQ